MICVSTVAIERYMGESLSDIVQGVRLKGILPGSRVGDELLSSLCEDKHYTVVQNVVVNMLKEIENHVISHLVIENEFLHFRIRIFGLLCGIWS